jgi:Membrane domain of glycerophosphoryl diester phosphodiesterase
MSVRALRPMTVGDILDQSFSIYRKNFVTLIGIVAVVQVPLLVLQIAGGLLFGTQLFNRNGSFVFTQTQTAAMLGGAGLFLLSAIVGGIASVFETSALSVVVSEYFLGNTVKLRQAYGRALRQWPALLLMIAVVGGASLILWALLFIPLFLLITVGALSDANASVGAAGTLIAALFTCIFCAALPVLFVLYYAAYVRLIFAPQAIVLEKLSGMNGLRRSWKLVEGSFWRVLGINIALSILVGIIGQGPVYVIAFMANLLPSPALAVAVNSMAQSLLNVAVLPLQFSALTLLYYDLRIRKEGFDLQLMAQQLIPAPSGPAADRMADIAGI